jgi:hypothetical protein
LHGSLSDVFGIQRFEKVDILALLEASLQYYEAHSIPAETATF